MTDAQLVAFREAAQRFHTGISGDIVALDRSNMRLNIQDDRLNDLIFNLFVEAHNELCNRFSNPIKVP